MPVKLLLEVGLGIDGSTECAHWDSEFSAAKCADCNDGRRTEPLDDSEIALFRRVVLLNHRTEEFNLLGLHSIYAPDHVDSDCPFRSRAGFFFLAARCFLIAALARAIVVRGKLNFF